MFTIKFWHPCSSEIVGISVWVVKYKQHFYLEEVGTPIYHYVSFIFIHELQRLKKSNIAIDSQVSDACECKMMCFYFYFELAYEEFCGLVNNGNSFQMNVWKSKIIFKFVAFSFALANLFIIKHFGKGKLRLLSV